jgi:hypothetical protein
MFDRKRKSIRNSVSNSETTMFSFFIESSDLHQVVCLLGKSAPIHIYDYRTEPEMWKILANDKREIWFYKKISSRVKRI